MLAQINCSVLEENISCWTLCFETLPTQHRGTPAEPYGNSGPGNHIKTLPGLLLRLGFTFANNVSYLPTGNAEDAHAAEHHKRSLIILSGWCTGMGCCVDRRTWFYHSAELSIPVLCVNRERAGKWSWAIIPTLHLSSALSKPISSTAPNSADWCNGRQSRRN